MYHFFMAVQCVYGCSDERGEDRDRKEGTEIPGGGERVEIAWPLFMQMTLFFALSQRRA